MPKIKSVLELSKFKVGQTVYWVVLRGDDMTCISESSYPAWIRIEHPKVLYERKLLPSLGGSRLPKLHASDFFFISQLLSQQPVVEEFKIKEIRRSANTGEFSYLNENDECMPESFLCCRRAEATKERSRLRKMMLEWLEESG